MVCTVPLAYIAYVHISLITYSSILLNSYIFNVTFTKILGGGYYRRYFGYDYRYGPYYVTFPAGKTRVPFSVTIYDDTTTVEYNETFHLHIYSGSLPALVSTGSNDSATVIILDDES